MKYAVSVRVIRTRARSTMPVNPIPATVAQNRSESGPQGANVEIVPSAPSKSIEAMWLPKLPCEW